MSGRWYRRVGERSGVVLAEWNLAPGHVVRERRSPIGVTVRCECGLASHANPAAKCAGASGKDQGRSAPT